MKNLFLQLSFFILLLGAAACKTEESNKHLPHYQATYNIKISVLWGSEEFPADSVAEAAFGEWVFMTHNKKVGDKVENPLLRFFELPFTRPSGELQSFILAEEQSSGGLLSIAELNVKNGNAGMYGVLPAKKVPYTIEDEQITLTVDHPWIDAVARINPSPDWFASFTDVSLLSGDQWLSKISYSAAFHDAGIFHDELDSAFQYAPQSAMGDLAYVKNLLGIHPFDFYYENPDKKGDYPFRKIVRLDLELVEGSIQAGE